MYAIVEDGGTQIKVEEGALIDVAIRDLDDGQTDLVFDRVLLIGGKKTPSLGRPYVDGASVAGELIPTRDGELVHKAEKIDVIKFRRRKGYRRKAGHRQRFLRVKITKISKG
ncbi:MAG: 50S ribosomal protein L21 [Phycisphaerales bacterium]|nr:50S ribosomal protein L21 [Phycisphaerales bacterium]